MAPRLDHLDIVMRDVARLGQSSSDIFLVDAENLSSITVAITGKEGTAYEGGVFNVRIEVPSKYPYRNPKVYFKDRIFHPNVDPDDGIVCLDFLKEKWSPSLSLLNACQFLRELMGDPNPASPLFGEAAVMLEESRDMYDRTALTWTKYFANGVHSYTPFEEMIERIAELNGNKIEALTLLTSAKWNMDDAANNVI